MSHRGRKIVDDSKAGGAEKAESQRAIEKEEITSTEFPEGGNTTSTKGHLGIPTGRDRQIGRQIDRQIDRQVGRQIDRQIDFFISFYLQPSRPVWAI